MKTTDFNLPMILLRRWWAILLCAAIGAGIAALYALSVPDWYRSSISVVPLVPTQDGALGSRLPVGVDPLFAAAQRIQAVLTSTSVADEVIEKFALEDRYGLADRDTARAELARHCGTNVDRNSGIIWLSCEDREPRLAKEITAHFGEVGNRVFGRVSASSAREERKFLEAQVKKTRNGVEEASRKLREFQSAHKIIDLSEQSRAVISAMAALKGEILSKQIEISYQGSFAADTESTVTQIRRQIGALTYRLRKLERASDDFFPAATAVPGLRFELEQLTREQKIQETLFFAMTQRFETAMVDEARDTSTFQILDHPTQPANPSRPRRMRIAMVGGFLGGVAACVVLALAALWRRQTSPRDGEVTQRIAIDRLRAR
jgi:tyrosine-protein kinase Etk/Wzc